MRIWFIFLFILVKPELQEVRNAYEKAVVSKEASILFHKMLASVTKKDDLRLVAYKGAGIALVSRFEETAKLKSTKFREGVEWIEWAVSKAPNDVEVRFVRLSVQQNAPKFLKYNTNILSDKEFVFSQLKLMRSADLRDYIRNYILHSDKFTDAEKALVASR